MVQAGPELNDVIEYEGFTGKNIAEEILNSVKQKMIFIK